MIGYVLSSMSNFICRIVLTDSHISFQFLSFKFSRIEEIFSYFHLQASAMIFKQKVYILRLGGHLDSLLYSSAQVKVTEKAKCALHVVYVDDYVCSSTSHQVGASGIIEDGSAGISDFKYVKDASCSVILQGLGEVPFL